MTQERTRRRIFSPNHSFYYILFFYLKKIKKKKKKNEYRRHVSLFNRHPQINVDILVENKMITAACNISWDLFNFRGKRRMQSYCLVNRLSLSGLLVAVYKKTNCCSALKPIDKSCKTKTFNLIE